MALRRTASVAALAVLVSLLTTIPAHAVDAEVEVVDFDFIPNEVSIDPGDSVTWTNTGVEPHTVTADDGSFDEWLDPGDSVTLEFTAEAYVPYYCALHGGPGGLGQAGAVLVGDVEPPPPPDLTPLQATDNVGAAIAWSQRNFPDGTDVALLGRDDVFADSLTSGAAQGSLGAPLLLTPSNSLADRTRNELRRLGVSEVILFGGTAALGPEVADALRAEGYELRRMRGPTRIGTAVNAATRLFPGADSVILARAFAEPGDPTRAFADSLSAGALAAMTGQPVVLTTTEFLHPETRDYIAGQGISDVTIIGGTAAVSEAAERELQGMGVVTERIFGANRFATAAAGLEMIGPRPVVTLIDGESPNAWAAGFPAASAGYPVLLTQTGSIPAETLDPIVAFGQEGVGFLCGPFLAEALCDQAKIAASATGFFSAEARWFFLEGRQEVAAGNDEASGVGAVYPTDDPGTICYEYELGGGELGELTGAHIHEGVRGEDGPIVVELSTRIDVATFDVHHACAFDVDPALVNDILTNHADYYVNLHTTEFPAGAIRGQLFQLTGVHLAFLSGDQETAGGDPEAEGFAPVVFPDYDGEICAAIFVFSPLGSPTTGAHIHEGGPGEDGDIVVPLRTPPQIGGDFGCYEVEQDLIDDIRDNPGEYYVNVHTEAYPAGAIRGQLGPF